MCFGRMQWKYSIYTPQRKLILSPTQVLDLETERLKHNRQILDHWAMFPAGHITEICSWKRFLKIFLFKIKHLVP